MVRPTAAAVAAATAAKAIRSVAAKMRFATCAGAKARQKRERKITFCKDKFVKKRESFYAPTNKKIKVNQTAKNICTELKLFKRYIFANQRIFERIKRKT